VARDKYPSGEKNRSGWIFFNALGMDFSNHKYYKRGCLACGGKTIGVIFGEKIKDSSNFRSKIK